MARSTHIIGGDTYAVLRLPEETYNEKGPNLKQTIEIIKARNGEFLTYTDMHRLQDVDMCGTGSLLRPGEFAYGGYTLDEESPEHRDKYGVITSILANHPDHDFRNPHICNKLSTRRAPVVLFIVKRRTQPNEPQALERKESTVTSHDEARK